MRLLATLVVGLVRDVLADALLAAAAQADDGGHGARSRWTRCARGPRARSRRSSAAGRRRARRCSCGSLGPAGPPLASGPQVLASARLLRAGGGRRPGGRAAGRARVRAAAGRGAGLRQAARAAARDVAGVDGRLARRRPVQHRRWRSRCCDRGRAGVARRAARGAPAERERRGWWAAARGWSRRARCPTRCAGGCGSGAEVVFARRVRRRWRCSSPTRPRCGGPRSRWTWRSSTPRTPSSSFPPHDPWMAGEDLNYYYLGHLRDGAADAGHRLGARRGLQPRARAARRASATAVFTLGGTLWAAARPRLAGVRGGAGGGRRRRGRRVPRARQPRRRARVAGRGRARRATTTGSRPRAWCPGRSTSSRGSRSCSGTCTRTCWRCRSRCWRSAFALQVVLAGPRGDAVWRGVAEALAAGARGRRAVRDQLVVVSGGGGPAGARGRHLAAVAGERGAARRTRSRWLVLVLAASVVLVLPFWLSFDPAAKGIGLGRRPRGRSATFVGDQALLYGLFAGPLVGRLRRPRARAAPAAAHAGRGARVAAIFAGSLLAPARPRRRRARRGAARASRCGALLAPARRAGALPVAARRRRPELRADARARVRARRVRRQRPDRMNTVFKLGYQAWLLLAVAAALRAAVGRRLAAAPARGRSWAARTARAPAARRRVPVRRHLRAQGRLRAARRRSTASRGCASARPGDPAAIDWLRAHTPGDAVVLEAVGEDYSAFGHAPHLDVHRAARRCSAGPATSSSGSHDPGTRAGGRRARSTRPPTSRPPAR